jgi:glycosyltransferase involved in cell wall biosynthesis
MANLDFLGMKMSQSEQKHNLLDDREVPLVSVALITFNHANFIEDCLQSILGQTFQNFEIVVADDYSSDGTADILEIYQQRFPKKIRFLHRDRNVGVTKNHNRAFYACRGKYIAWMSGDDLMLPNKLARQVAFLEAHPDCDICYHDLEYFDSASNERFFLKSEIDTPRDGDVNTSVKYGCVNGGVSNVVRRSAAPSQGFDERVPIASDWLFWVETLMNGGKIQYLDEVLARHRRHENNVTSDSIKSPSLPEIQDHLISAAIILSNAPGQLRNIRHRRAHLYPMLRWLNDGRSYEEYLQLSLSERFRMKIFAALLASKFLGIRR